MILLDRLLDGLDIRVETFALCQVSASEPLTLRRDPRPTVHYSLAGGGRLHAGGLPPIAFGRHSFIVLPPCMPARLEADASEGVEAWRGPSRCERLPGAGATQETSAAVLACGRIAATFRGSAGLFDHLSEPIVDDFACDDGICQPFEALLAEIAEPKPGTTALVDGLMRQCLVLLLRRYCESGECRLPWLSALEDPRLGRALVAMLEHPERDFSLAGLAELAGMSRSSFAAHFTETFGRTPIELLKDLRLRRAAELLRTTDLPVKAVAPRVGYASRSYFSRAFKAHYGVDPLAYRRDEASA